jgi:hypothetical protein
LSELSRDVARYDALLKAFAQQVAWCSGPSPFTSRLLERSRLWLAEDASALTALGALTADPLAGAVALRWAAALHHLALRGLAPWAALWPPAQRSAAPSDAELDGAIRQAWREHRPALDRGLALPPQTNEVQRSAVLTTGLHHIAARTGLPLALLEIGSSAGLNLWCERYRYEIGGWRWGDDAAAVVLRAACSGDLPPPATLTVLARSGCDSHPIDVGQPGETLRLASFIWPDQAERLQRLRAAAAAAAQWSAAEGVAVQACAAASFVEQALAERPAGATTVVMHSVVWQYIAAPEQTRIRTSLEAAGQQATPDAPLAWLRMEPPEADLTMELRCRLWPHGEDRLLAHVHPHGASITWLDNPAA